MNLEDINYIISVIRSSVTDLEQYALELQMGDNKEQTENSIMQCLLFINETISDLI